MNAKKRNPKQDDNELIFRLDDEDINQALVDFVSRELRFLHIVLKQPYAQIAREMGVGAQCIANFCKHKAKYPQVRTVFPILAHLDLEYDPLKNAIVRRHSNVVPLGSKGDAS